MKLISRNIHRSVLQLLNERTGNFEQITQPPLFPFTPVDPIPVSGSLLPAQSDDIDSQTRLSPLTDVNEAEMTSKSFWSEFEDDQFVDDVVPQKKKRKVN